MIIYAECDIQVMHRNRSCLESVLLSRTYINVLIYIHIFFFCEMTQITCYGIVQITCFSMSLYVIMNLLQCLH